MAKYERERKFLVDADKWEEFKNMATGHIRIVQGYLSKRKEATVRIRIAGDKAWLTVKGVNSGDTCEEYEYAIPVEDAERLILMCEPGYIEKTRWFFNWKGFKYEIDIFEGRLDGLRICEVELPLSFDGTIELPPFITEEVTGDPRYYNSNL